MKKVLIISIDCDDDGVTCGDCKFYHDDPDNYESYCHLYDVPLLGIARTLDCLQSDLSREVLRWSAEDVARAKERAQALGKLLGIAAKLSEKE